MLFSLHFVDTASYSLFFAYTLYLSGFLLDTNYPWVHSHVMCELNALEP